MEELTVQSWTNYPYTKSPKIPQVGGWVHKKTNVADIQYTANKVGGLKKIQKCDRYCIDGP